VPQSGDSPVPLLVRHRRSGGTHVADRRVAGLHRAAGLSGPTRRYTVIVVMLATMSSLPIIAAISAGSANVGDSVDASGTTPFIAPPSEGPVVVPPPPPALPAEVPVPAGVAERLRAVEPKREPRQRRPVRKLKRPARATESAPAPKSPRPSEPVKPPKPPKPPVSPSPSPSPSPTPSPRPSMIPRPPLPSGPYVPLPPSVSPSVPPTGLPTCWPDLDACLSDLGANVRP
jgi:hypothetical protein